MLLNLIENAFLERAQPLTTTILTAPKDDMYDDAKAFEGKMWQDVTCRDFEDHMSAPIAFNPEAFCYYLPGIFSATVRENQPSMIAVDSILGTLDFSSPEHLDNFFYERWPKLTLEECEATQHWLLWLASTDPQNNMDVPYPRAHNPVSRAFDTLNYLIDIKKSKS